MQLRHAIELLSKLVLVEPPRDLSASLVRRRFARQGRRRVANNEMERAYPRVWQGVNR